MVHHHKSYLFIHMIHTYISKHCYTKTFDLLTHVTLLFTWLPYTLYNIYFKSSIKHGSLQVHILYKKIKISFMNVFQHLSFDKGHNVALTQSLLAAMSPRLERVTYNFKESSSFLLNNLNVAMLGPMFTQMTRSLCMFFRWFFMI